MNFDDQMKLIEQVVSEFSFEKRTPKTFDKIKEKLRKTIPDIGTCFIRSDPNDPSKIYINFLLHDGLNYMNCEYHGPEVHGPEV